jgi:TamB, inner membrane protein subunit of TAM complex
MEVIRERMFKKITLALFLGFFLVIFYAQYDVWTHQKLLSYMQKLTHTSLNGTFSASIHSLNFFCPSLVLHDMHMSAPDSEQWHWRCKRCEISASWLQLLFTGTLDQHIMMDGFEFYSSIENNHLAIEPHITAMFAQSFTPFISEIKSIICKNSFLHLLDTAINTELSLFFTSSSLRIRDQLKTTLSINDGFLSYEKNNYIEKIASDISLLSKWSEKSCEINAQIAGTFMLSHMGDHGNCYLTGVWNTDRGRFSLRNAYNSLQIDPIIINEKEIRIAGHFPLSYPIQCLRNSTQDQTINGTVHCAAKAARESLGKIDGQIVVENVHFKDTLVCDVGKCIFDRHDADWTMRVAISRNNQECKGLGYWSERERKGELSIKNNTDLFTSLFPYWRIKHTDFSTQIAIDQQTLRGSYQITATHSFSALRHYVQGEFAANQTEVSTSGVIDTDTFNVHGQLYPELQLNHCCYIDKDARELVSLSSTDIPHQIHGSIAFPFIRSLINSCVGYDVQGEGTLDIVAHMTLPEIVADVSLKDASIRLPQTYNFIDGFAAHCTYNLRDKLLIGEDIHLSLHTGKINCLRASYYFNEKGLLRSMHMPVLMDSCLFNIKKDLFAIVSGNLLFFQSSSVPAQVSGNILIDRAQLKENLFSGVIQKQLLSYTHSVFSLPDFPLECDLSFETKSPICVDTGFLQTDAQLDLHVKKGKGDPLIAGTIGLHSGTLNFPYKPLYISRGVITFVPEQLFDPTIEFVARNKIKKYDVSLQIEGSLLTHHISLDANPPLSEEQIVSLLLVGSEEHSLNSMMPALIVQNLKNLIFSNNQLSFFDKYFKHILGTFNINLIPSFIDQTGRGGLRGALEITVDDRWRALIQKNFSLTEDTKFELEYLFSDDMTLRAIRDERRDLGGEVEMKWKF